MRDSWTPTGANREYPTIEDSVSLGREKLFHFLSRRMHTGGVRLEVAKFAAELARKEGGPR